MCIRDRTYGFVHADWTHLLFNMITFWSFGSAVERVFSAWITPLGFVLFYLSAIVVSILPTFIKHQRDPNYRSLGASGGVSAVLFAAILFDPWTKLIIFPIPVPIPAFLFAVLYAVSYTHLTGLFLIALGSGGIKPLVVSFCGDQFTSANKHLAKLVFDGFYWTINFGSFFASLLMPLFLRNLGPAVAFGIPGVLMFIATILFWLGRGQYVRVPPSRGEDPHAFFNVARSALLAQAPGESRTGLLVAAAGALLAMAMLLCWALHAVFGVAPVSYTHLDVYKRQGWGGSTL